MYDLEKLLASELQSAQTQLEAAEIAYIDATAAVEEARKRADRLQAAVAALTGAAPSGQPETPPEEPRRPKPVSDNPLAHIKCAGCGSKGSMSEQYVQAPSGANVRMLVCSQCGNQTF